MTDREQALVNVSRDALRWFHNMLRGTALNGMHDDLLVARSLDRVLREYADVPAVRDRDRQFPVPPFDQAAVNEDIVTRAIRKQWQTDKEQAS